MVSVAVSKLAETDLVFVQLDAKINSVYYRENVLKTRFIAGNLPYLEQQLVFMIAMFKLFYNTIAACQRPVGSSLSNKCMYGSAACTPFTPHCRLGLPAFRCA